GFVFFTAGLLTFEFALGLGRNTGTSNKALRSILEQPFGQLLLLIIGIGLVCYCLWCWIQMLFSPEDTDTLPWRRWFHRGTYAVKGIAYGGLAWTAFDLASGVRGRDQSLSQLVYSVLQQPWGQSAVIGGGIGVILVGLKLGSQVVTQDFRDRYRFKQIREEGTLRLLKVARLGWIARGSIFVLVGAFVVQAGWQYKPGAAKDSSEAMEALVMLPGGRWILMAIAIGLMLHSLQMLMEARYRPLKSIEILNQELLNSQKNS
ncbi:MAG: DUF1206 domain-containing protein, partial [Cyanobacteria bacterium P01_C01_bin.89]